MPIRVTDDDVKEIIDLDDSRTDLYPFIKAASLIIDNTCTSPLLSDELKKEIERWLSAHFCAIRDVRASSEAVGTLRVGYQYKVDLNLAQTQYGQQAMMLDFSGALSRLNKNKTKTSFNFIGGTIE
jgi:hypothetical protein